VLRARRDGGRNPQLPELCNGMERREGGGRRNRSREVEGHQEGEEGKEPREDGRRTGREGVEEDQRVTE
jgi:hypothetical protein